MKTRKCDFVQYVFECKGKKNGFATLQADALSTELLLQFVSYLVDACLLFLFLPLSSPRAIILTLKAYYFSAEYKAKEKKNNSAFSLLNKVFLPFFFSFRASALAATFFILIFFFFTAVHVCISISI